MLTYELKKSPGVPLYEALYHCIRQDIQRMTALRGREFTGAVMVSGGIRNRELVANFPARTGLKLRCGVAEASARGNLLNIADVLTAEK